MEHATHAEHEHTHGASCGHTRIRHDDHVDYLHDGHLHSMHDGHADEHVLPSSADAERCNGPHRCSGHEEGHRHGASCGHEAVPHGEHTDYLVGGHLHHQHGEHCDTHGEVALA